MGGGSRKAAIDHHHLSGDVAGVLAGEIEVRWSSHQTFRLRHIRALAGSIEFGAARKKTSREGREYLSAELDDPSFPAPIYASLVQAEDGESLLLIWSRRNGD